MKTIPLFGTGFPHKSRTVSNQKRTNLYVVPGNDKSQFSLACTPGLVQFADVEAGPSRGAISVNGNIFSVHGTGFYIISPSGGFTLLGYIGTDSGPVSMAWSGVELLLVDGSKGYRFETAGGTFTAVADADFPPNPTTVTFIAGLFVVSEGGTGRFHWSAPLDATTWDALDFATAESETDNLVAVAADHGSLVLLGTLTTEFWSAVGGTQAFARVGGSGVEWGCAAVQTIAKGDTGLIWLAKNQLGECRVVRLQGYQPVPVDDADVAYVINAQGNVADATGFSYLQDGRTFYQLNVGEVSLLWDGIGWSYSSSGSEGGRHLGNLRASLSDRPYVASYTDGKWYTLDKEKFTDNGLPIVREVVSKHFVADFNPVTIWELFLDCEVGAADAQMMLQYSKDAGATWSNELWSSMGALGDYTKRVIWRRLGRARDIVLKFRMTDPVRCVITSAAVVIE